VEDVDDRPTEPDERDDYSESDAVIDEALAAGDPDGSAIPEGTRPVDRFRRTTVGSIAAAGLLGLADALEGRREKDEPAIVVDAPSTRHDPDDPIDVQLDFDHPERSRIVIRRADPPADAAD
jgi:hypothetical protein